MRIETDVHLGYENVLIQQNPSDILSRNNVQVQRTFQFKYSPHTITCVPIIASNMVNVGTMEMARAMKPLRMMVALIKTYSEQELIDFFLDPDTDPDLVFYSMGWKSDEIVKLHRVQAHCGNRIKLVNIDTPHGQISGFIDYVRLVRKAFPNIVISAGNVSTPEGVLQLVTQGKADIVKCGVGNGAACKTTLKTGVGCKPITMNDKCGDMAHGLNGAHIISDGGIYEEGSICKAFCSKADFVMIGSFFSGYLGPKVVGEDGNEYIEFYGNSSRKANEKHFGGLREYRASEGREMLVPVKGDIKELFGSILGSLRSCGSYIGARRLKDFPKCATFIKVEKPLNITMAHLDHSKH